VPERLALAVAGLLLVFPSLIEGLLEALIGRDIGYTATFGLGIAAAVLLEQRMQPAAPQVQATGRQ
jgi:hypothetical protein